MNKYYTDDTKDTPAIVGFLYIIRCDLSNKIYVGSTTDIIGRWNSHKTGQNGTKSTELINKGRCSIEIYETYYNILRSDLYDKEKALILKYIDVVVNDKPVIYDNGLSKKEHRNQRAREYQKEYRRNNAEKFDKIKQDAIDAKIDLIKCCNSTETTEDNRVKAYKQIFNLLIKPYRIIDDPEYINRLIDATQYNNIIINDRQNTYDKDDIIITNSDMINIFNNDDIKYTILDFGDYKNNKIDTKSDMFKMLFKSMAYGGRGVKYIDKNTTEQTAKIKIYIKYNVNIDTLYIRSSNRYVFNGGVVEFTNIEKGRNVQTSIPAYLFNRYTEDEVLKVRKGVYIKQSQPLLKVETKASKNIKRSIQYIHTGDTIDKIPLYKQTITRYNAEPYHIYTPYTPNPAVITITTTQPHKALQEDINDDIIAYIKNKGVPLTL